MSTLSPKNSTKKNGEKYGKPKGSSFRFFTNQHLEKFPSDKSLSTVTSLNASGNPFTNFTGMIEMPYLHDITLDNTELISFQGSVELPSLVRISLKNTPISHYHTLGIMCSIAFGQKLRFLNQENITALSLSTADQLRPHLRPLLAQGWILTCVNPIRLYHSVTRARRVMSIAINTEVHKRIEEDVIVYPACESQTSVSEIEERRDAEKDFESNDSDDEVIKNANETITKMNNQMVKDAQNRGGHKIAFEETNEPKKPSMASIRVINRTKGGVDECDNMKSVWPAEKEMPYVHRDEFDQGPYKERMEKARSRSASRQQTQKEDIEEEEQNEVIPEKENDAEEVHETEADE